MRWLEGTRARLRLLFARRGAEERMETEFRFHLEMEAERLMREEGLDPQEAWRRARVAFGGRDKYKEEMREGRRPAWLMGLRMDLRHGIRALRAAPAFTAICILILGLGIGTATAIFAAFDAVLLQDLPVTDSDRVVTLTARRGTGTGHAVSPDELDALRRASRTLRDGAGVVWDRAINMPLIEGDRPLVLDFAFVTANFFDVLGARPALGRLFRPEDGAEGAAPVTVISYPTWQREFGGDPGVLGRRLTATQSLSLGPYAIVGVAPPGLDYPVGVDYWILPGPRRQAGNVVARLMPDVPPEAARSEFLSIVQALDRERTNPGSPTAATIRPLTDAVLGDTRPIAIAITVAVALLLLIACVNVASLLLMRATRRFGDVMVRRALGATSGEIVRLFFVESALLGIAGGIMGLVLALVLLRIIPAWAAAELPRTEMIGLAASPVAVAIGVTVLSVLVFGFLPAVATATGNVASALRSEVRSGSGSRGSRHIRRSLVAAQVALAAIILVGAGLLLRTLQRLDQLELGYETEGVTIIELSIDRGGLEGEAPGVFVMLEGIFQRLRGLPGVTAVTPVFSRPFIGASVQVRPLLEGQPESEIEANPRLPLEWVGSEFFRTFGVPILRGRGLLEHDQEDAPKVAVVSQAVAERLWPGRDPIGQRIRMTLREEAWWTIVGVAGDTRFQRLREPTPTIYLPWRQFQVLPMVWTVAVRTEHDLGSLVPFMRRTLHDFNSRIVVWRTGTMTDHLARGPLAQPRTSALLFSGFGVVALLLAAVGLYGVLALAVRERTRELGIRRALGAPTARLRRNVLRDALTVTAGGTAVGLTGGLLASSLLDKLLFEISRADHVTLVGVCVVLLGVSLVAAYVPARRATRIDPMLALRDNWR